jgi:histidinol-phosphate aminotransferase
MIGRPETLRRLAQHQYGTSMNALGVAAAIASIGDDERITQERNRNTEARDFTIGWFQRNGFKVSDSQANFIFVDVKRPLAEFRDPCRERSVLVGRPFPPMTTHCRISIGTIDEMRKAVGVFGEVLGVKATAAA